MTVRLMLTCLCDAFYGEVGIATVRVLEAAGCRVEFPEGQTCCGQPAFNAGDRSAARTMAARTQSLFAGSTVVVPSASCAAMTRHGAHILGLEELRSFELCDFLVRELGIEKWPPRPNAAFARRKIAYHPACHHRSLDGFGSAERLLATIPGVELVPIGDPEQCCGFGGVFSMSHEELSANIGRDKMAKASLADEFVGSDMGCLMHLRSLGAGVRIRHVSEVLAEALG